MTKKTLKQLYTLECELEMWRNYLQKIASSSLVPSAALSHMPTAPGVVSDKVFKIVASKDRIERKIQQIQERLIKKRERILSFISTIPNGVLRQAIFYRYVTFYSWANVAATLGGRSTADSIRMACHRFLSQS